jgi:pyrroloquinoline quinone (PQQ) biosynthesis protein C
MSEIEELVLEAQRHRAVNHPYLLALENGSLNNPRLAIEDFSVQYSGYTSWFPRYLTAAISKISTPSHRNHLLNNLSEENGNIEPEEIELLKSLGIEEDWVQGIPHPKLFKRFQKSLGISENLKLADETEIWRELFLNVIYGGSEPEVIGAIGIGTESVVKYIYKYITRGIQAHTDLNKYDYVFFELHSEIDDEHGKVMIQIAEDIIKKSPESLSQLRKGMLKALNLRAMFWDMMLERANKL